MGGRKIGCLITSCLIFLLKSVAFYFELLIGLVFRIKISDKSYRIDSSISDSTRIEKRMPAFSFKYQGQNFEERITRIEEKEQDRSIAADVRNYQFISGKDFYGFVEEPESKTVRVHESFPGFKEELDAELRFLSVEDFLKPSKESNFEKESRSDNGGIMSSLFDKSFLSSETNSKRNFFSFDFESDTESSSDGYSVKELICNSDTDDILSENGLDSIGYIIDEEETIAEKLHSLVEEEFSLESNSDEIFEENKLIGISSLESGNSSDPDSRAENTLQIEFINEISSSENDGTKSDNFKGDQLVKDEADLDPKAEVLAIDGSNYEASSSSKVEEKQEEESKSLDLNSEELDEIWEHLDLIEQLKMELKKVRAIGLPTILEESESPKAIDYLRPRRINEQFLFDGPMDELKKFYKSYRERMRKFDILNYQKMYAMGFLQLKNPLNSMRTQREFLSAFMSQISQCLLPFYRKKFENDPSKKLIKDLKCDLETVYVGQTCLSWEFLRWQYEKSRELPESDPHRSRRYNQVADEFQKFQVLVQRFTENEIFQGPRLPNYVKQRCLLQNLLQVPVMKEDSLSDNMERKEADYVVTSEMLEDIMEEAIRIFWEFVKAEKHETPLLVKLLFDNNAEVQDPSDYEIMEEIQQNLQKKEKKLKDILRTGNCVVKKFKKPKEDRSNQDLFFSQVDLKLVSRVLRMPRITRDQLVWCDKKLSKINFNEGKVHRESSFLLFPC